LAATDPRVKRVVLISTPGRSLLDVRTSQLLTRSGPEAAEALRSEVAKLLATRTIPPLDTLRTEVRPLLPGQEARLLAELYEFDPAAVATKVKVPTMIVVPADPAPYDSQRLAAAIPGCPSGHLFGKRLDVGGFRPNAGGPVRPGCGQP